MVLVLPRGTKVFEDEYVDYVLTFEEIGAWFVANDIEVCLLDGIELENPPSKEARGFAVAGGVAAAVAACASKEHEVKPVSVNGLSAKALKKLKYYAQAGCRDGNLVEVMACEGGCVAGAGAMAVPKFAAKEVAKICAQSEALKKE